MTDAMQGSVVINAQYVKDLSFENPNAPNSLTSGIQPDINVDLDVQAKHIQNEMFEVSISVNIQASAEDNPLFVIDLTYAGLFGVKSEDKEIILLVHCANILFPYVRRLISDMTRDGGFAPLMLSPVDFMGRYYETKNEQKKNGTQLNT